MTTYATNRRYERIRTGHGGIRSALQTGQDEGVGHCLGVIPDDTLSDRTHRPADNPA